MTRAGAGLGKRMQVSEEDNQVAFVNKNDKPWDEAHKYSENSVPLSQMLMMLMLQTTFIAHHIQIFHSCILEQHKALQFLPVRHEKEYVCFVEWWGRELSAYLSPIFLFIVVALVMRRQCDSQNCSSDSNKKNPPLPFLHLSAFLMFSAALCLSHLTLLSDIWKVLLVAAVHFLVQTLKSDLFFQVQTLERLKARKKNIF